MSAYATIKDFSTTPITAVATPEFVVEATTTKAPAAYSQQTLIGKIVAYIPADVIVVYLTAAAFIPKTAPNWLLVWGPFLIGVVAFVLISIKAITDVRSSRKNGRWATSLSAVITLVLFALYISMLAENPFLVAFGIPVWAGTLVALIATVALGLWGDKLKKLASPTT